MSLSPIGCYPLVSRVYPRPDRRVFDTAAVIAPCCFTIATACSDAAIGVSNCCNVSLIKVRYWVSLRLTTHNLDCN